MLPTQSTGRHRSTYRPCGRIFYFTPRDRQIMLFIWRWKLASTATIHEATGRPNSPYSTYKVLEKLAKHDYLTNVRSVEHRFTAWQLTDKGFSSIRESLGDLNEEGFLSENHNHDRNVLAFHLGEWMSHGFPSVSHFTEQEMRRYPVERFPTWVPEVTSHRADGYTKIQGANKTQILAYEVELWAKSTARYEAVIRFYKMVRNLSRIYWLVPDRTVKEQILRAKSCVKDDSTNYHVFVDLQQYIERGWDSTVTNERSENLFTIRENMRGILGDIYGEYVGNMRGNSTVTVHYDPNKVLGKRRG